MSGPNKMVPKLWESQVARALKSATPDWLPKTRPTRRQKFRYWWQVTVLGKWPLMWKKNCPGEDD